MGGEVLIALYWTRGGGWAGDRLFTQGSFSAVSGRIKVRLVGYRSKRPVSLLIVEFGTVQKFVQKFECQVRKYVRL